MKKFISMGICIILITFSCINVFAKNDPVNKTVSEEKIACSATIHDEFIGGEIIVTLTNNSSLQFNNYEASDFTEINATEVYNLTEHSTEQAKDELNNNSDYTQSDVQYVACDTFNQILDIKIDTEDKASTLSAIKEIETRSDVLYAEPNYIYSTDATPNDPCLSVQPATEKDRMDLIDAWNITTGSKAVKVGIIDSGINKNHPDLIDAYDTKLSKSFNGFKEYESGSDEHGTHVAGIIGGTGNNGIGIAGVCWNVSLVSLRTADNNGFSYHTDVIKAIDYAKSKGIKIINFSSNSDQYSNSLKNTIEKYNGIFVCSAGNDGINIDTNSVKSYPSAYNLSNVISVASVDSLELLDPNSNTGKKSVNVAAQGVDVVSTYRDTYISKSGTSMAAPQVSGVAALLLSKYPNLSVSEVKSAIVNTVNKKSWLNDKVSSGGIVNAFKALSSIENKSYTVKYNPNGGTGLMENTTVLFGQDTPLRENLFEYKGFKFMGWYANRQSDNKWLYKSNLTGEGKWCLQGTQPENYALSLYKDKAGIAKTSSINKDIVTMYAQWDVVVGDINQDGNININDITILQKYLADLVSLTESQIKASDIDGNGRVTIADSTLLQKMILLQS